MDTSERKSRAKTLWHQCFAQLVRDGAPPGAEVQPEIDLPDQPRRPDLLLLRRRGEPRRDDQASVLRGLWPHIDRAALVEFKSPARGFRRNGLLRLVVYGLRFHMAERERQAGGGAQAIDDGRQLVLAVPNVNKALADEFEHMGWRREPLGGGYARIVGPMYTSLLVEIDEVSEAEKDEYLRVVSTLHPTSEAAVFFLRRWYTEPIMQEIENMEGYDEVLAKLLASLPPEKRLQGLSPEQRLQGLSPDEEAVTQFLASLPPEQRLLAMPDEALAALPDEYLRSLSPDTQEAIRRRLNRS